MAKVKAKKISVNAFEKVVSEKYTPIETFDWSGIEVVVKKTLSLKEMLEFVDGVVKSCFNEDTNAYRPEAKDFAIKISVLEKYANFTMPKNIEAKYDLIYQSDVVYHILQHINLVQYNEIVSAIDKKVDNLAQANIEAVNRQINELYNSFENLQNSMESMVSGINSEELNKAIMYLSKGQMFENDKVAELYNEVKEKAEDGV